MKCQDEPPGVQAFCSRRARQAARAPRPRATAATVPANSSGIAPFARAARPVSAPATRCWSGRPGWFPSGPAWRVAPVAPLGLLLGSVDVKLKRGRPWHNKKLSRKRRRTGSNTTHTSLERKGGSMAGPNHLIDPATLAEVNVDGLIPAGPVNYQCLYESKQTCCLGKRA